MTNDMSPLSGITSLIQAWSWNVLVPTLCVQSRFGALLCIWHAMSSRFDTTSSPVMFGVKTWLPHRCQHGLKKCGTLDFLLRWRRLTCKNRRILCQMALCGAFTIRFPCRFSLTIWSPGVETSAVSCRMRFRPASVHKISPWIWKLSWFSANLICYRNKAKNARRFRKNAGKKATCEISHTNTGWFTTGNCSLTQSWRLDPSWLDNHVNVDPLLVYRRRVNAEIIYKACFWPNNVEIYY